LEEKKITAAVLKTMGAAASLLPVPSTFIGFASTVKICFEEMIGHGV